MILSQVREMQREEKQLEAALTAILVRVNELKNGIIGLLHKIDNEFETINWPTFLDNYALLAGHVRIILCIMYKYMIIIII